MDANGTDPSDQGGLLPSADVAGASRRAVLGREQTTSDALQRASDVDQTAADVDQSVADIARERSDRDRYLSDADQRFSDHDQALADRSEGALNDPGQPARDAARTAREQITAARAMTATMREQAATDRFELAEERDEAARVRDRASTARDVESAARDLEAGLQEFGDAAAVRRRAAADRVRAAEDRLQAADDREQTSVDRDELRAALSQRQFDDLTGTYRRGPGNIALQAELDRAHRSNRPLVIAFVDIDNMKQHNDTGGHVAGDELLIEVVECMRQNLRAYDPIVRFGGDEFVCALSDADMVDARHRFHTVIAALQGLRPGASISVGLARLRPDEDLETLIARGDAALLEAKKNPPMNGPEEYLEELPIPGAATAVSDASRLALVKELGCFTGSDQGGMNVVTRMAAQLLSVQTAAITIIGETTQTVVARTHAPGSLDGDPEGLAHGLCRRVVNSGAPLAIENTATDVPLVDRVKAQQSGVAAYAGLPLRLTGGEVVGTLCVTDAVPRRWSASEMAALGELAMLAIDQLDHHRARVALGTRDPVTGLPRLALFTDHLKALLADRAKDDDSVTLVVADLAGFRLLNDAWGYQVGDAILGEVARRLESITAHYGERGSVCRIHGDRFLIAASIASQERRETLVAYVRRAITGRPVEIQGHEQPLDGRVWAVTSRADITAPELINSAGSTAENARQLARTNDPATAPVGNSARARLEIRNALQGAQDRDELLLYYQPLMELGTGAITGFEALLRWRHPQLGPVSPLDFIPLAESSGAIVPIGEWVLDTALQALAVWRARPGAQDLDIAVNVAPEQLMRGDFSRHVAASLQSAGVPARALTLEITERTLVADEPSTRRTLQELRALGVKLSLDDFGTGFSSLGRLAEFDLDELKIDRLFVSGLTPKTRQAGVVAGIIAMSKALGLRVIAEGIETPAQRATLTAMGVEHGQGFLLGRPTPEHDVPALLTPMTVLAPAAPAAPAALPIRGERTA